METERARDTRIDLVLFPALDFFKFKSEMETIASFLKLQTSRITRTDNAIP